MRGNDLVSKIQSIPEGVKIQAACLVGSDIHGLFLCQESLVQWAKEKGDLDTGIDLKYSKEEGFVWLISDRNEPLTGDREFGEGIN